MRVIDPVEEAPCGRLTDAVVTDLVGAVTQGQLLESLLDGVSRSLQDMIPRLGCLTPLSYQF